mmetsp:Transcript_161619/g.513601  ORF Transcript_161619/g.513601 Transcript_161619/m.513601 type:complete len:242 (-) Transcript_161619:896-1621(-)
MMVGWRAAVLHVNTTFAGKPGRPYNLLSLLLQGCHRSCAGMARAALCPLWLVSEGGHLDQVIAETFHFALGSLLKVPQLLRASVTETRRLRQRLQIPHCPLYIMESPFVEMFTSCCDNHVDQLVRFALQGLVHLVEFWNEFDQGGAIMGMHPFREQSQRASFNLTCFPIKGGTWCQFELVQSNLTHVIICLPEASSHCRHYCSPLSLARRLTTLLHPRMCLLRLASMLLTLREQRMSLNAE